MEAVILKALILIAFAIGFIILFIILIRLFGAWMLRINTIIALQRKILKAIISISKGEAVTQSDPKYMQYMTDEEKARLYDLKNKKNK